MTPEDIARINYEKSRKAQAENKRIISDLQKRVERLEEMVSGLLEKAGLKPEKAETIQTKTAGEAKPKKAKSKPADASKTE